MPEKYILLKDKPGHKQTISKWNLLSKPPINEFIPKGSLLVELTEDESREIHQFPSVNYKKYSNNSVKLYCKPEDVRQLNVEDFNLLLGIKQPLDCYKALEDLNWVRELKIGDNINVTISAIPKPVCGVVRYIGPLSDELGTKFGLELSVRI